MFKAKKAIACVAADIMSLLLLKAPGKLGADVVLGSAQRFGVPMGYGGPHAAFFATRDAYKRSLPGRIIGVSKDRLGNDALRMAMQTREQTHSPRQSQLKYLYSAGTTCQHGGVLCGVPWPTRLKNYCAAYTPLC